MTIKLMPKHLSMFKSYLRAQKLNEIPAWEEITMRGGYSPETVLYFEETFDEIIAAAARNSGVANKIQIVSSNSDLCTRCNRECDRHEKAPDIMSKLKLTPGFEYTAGRVVQGLRQILEAQ